MNIMPLTYAQIDLQAIRHNLTIIERLAQKHKFHLPTRKKSEPALFSSMHLLPVIKADAYGHGVEQIAKVLDTAGVEFFGLSDVAEGVQLRSMGIKKPILLFESTLPEFSKLIVKHDLIPTVCTVDLARALNQEAEKRGKNIQVHVKIDTGMGRLGIWHEEAFLFIKELFSLRHLIVHGIYTHFPVADSDKPFTQKQIKILYELVLRLDRSGMVIPFIHAANSMGLAGYRTHVLNLARPGIMLYGLQPDDKISLKIGLRPAMSVHSKVIFIKKIQKGRGISYGRTFIAKKDMTVATVPIGYSNGYFRCFSNFAKVLIDGQRCPVVGRVTMDQIIVDVSALKDPHVGASVVILGRQGQDEITAEELAVLAGTINYEIVCSLGSRLPRFYLK